MGWKRQISSNFGTEYHTCPLIRITGTTYFMTSHDPSQYQEILDVAVLSNVQTSGTFLLRQGTTTIAAFTTGTLLVGTQYNAPLSGTIRFLGDTVFNISTSGETTGSYNVMVLYKNVK